MKMDVRELIKEISALLADTGSTTKYDLCKEINDLSSSEMHKLYKQLSNEHKGVYDSRYHNLRNSLGLWYSCVLFADILLPGDGEDPVGTRMEAVAREALLWCPGAVAAQVVLNTGGENAKSVKVCSATIGEIKAEVFHDVTQDYARERGTSALLKIHWRQNQRCTDVKSNDLPVEGRKIDQVPQELKSVQFHSGFVDSLGDKSVTPVSTFFEYCHKKKLLFCSDNKCSALLHFASGLDASVHRAENAGGIVHLYIVVCRENGKNEVDVPEAYQGTMHALLNRLANFAVVVKLQQEQQVLRIYKQMFDLIGDPLKRVTRILIDAQQEVQRVNAIINPPFHVLADAHQVVKDYFTQGRQAGWGSVRWKISHSPADYALGGADTIQEKLRKNHACGCTLAAVVLGIFGRNAPPDGNESALFGEFMRVMESRDDAYEELRELMSIILWKEEDKEKFYKQFRTAVLRTSANSNSCLTDALIRLKEIIFQAFKLDETKYPGLALAVALWEWKKDNKFDSALEDEPIFVTDYIKNPTSAEDIFKNVIFPFPTYGCLLSFLSSVIAAARSNSVSDNIKVIYIENCLLLKLEDSSEWPLAENPAPLYEMMKRSAESGEPSLRGDLYKPYADIASLCKGGRAHVHNDRWAYVYTDAQGQSRTFSIQLYESCLKIGFQAS